MVSYIRFGAFLLVTALIFGVQQAELRAQGAPGPAPPPPWWEFINPVTAQPLFVFPKKANLACDGNSAVPSAAYTVRATRASTPGVTISIFTGTSTTTNTWAGTLPVPAFGEWPTGGTDITVRLYSSNPWAPGTIEDIETIQFQ